MTLPRPPGLAGIKSWFVRAFNSRVNKVHSAVQQSHHPAPRSSRSYSSLPSSSTPRTTTHRTQPFYLSSSQSRGLHQWYTPKFNKSTPNFGRIKFSPTFYFLRPQVGVFPRSGWGPPGGAALFHTSPSSSAVVLNQIAHSVSKALSTGLHPPNRVIQPVRGAIAAHVAAGAAAQTTDGPAGYIRFPLSPPAWTPTDSDLSDPDVIKAIDTHISELQRVKKAILKLKRYGDFPVRAVLPSDPEARIDVLFRGATAEDVARWNKNEFKLASGRVGADQVFCAGRFEEYVAWSEVLDAERKVEREMERGNADRGVLQFWGELNLMEGRIH